MHCGEIMRIALKTSTKDETVKARDVQLKVG